MTSAASPAILASHCGLSAPRTHAPTAFTPCPNNVAFCVGARSGAQDRNQLNVTVHGQDGNQETQAYQVIRIARNTVGNTAATVSESVDPSACIKSEVYADYEDPSPGIGRLHCPALPVGGRHDRVPGPDAARATAPAPAPVRGLCRRPGDVSLLGAIRGGSATTSTTGSIALRTPAGCSRVDHAVAGPRCEDHTLEILTLVNQLLNLNKNQNELPATERGAGRQLNRDELAGLASGNGRDRAGPACRLSATIARRRQLPARRRAGARWGHTSTSS